MPPRRRARSPDESQQPYADTDNESDGEQATPRPHKQGLKKRLSEAYVPDNDGSFSPESGKRAQRQQVDVNDDAAEKRKRRKTTKITVIEDEPHEGEHEGGESSRAGKQKQTLRSVAPPTAINLPFDVMSSNYEEWMKMATDNKITANNTWNFALIDYFHDMSLLRNTDDNSINFQRASCTLDGCVKIWTSRVDSVGTETNKLVGSLANNGRDAEESDDEGGNGSDNPDGEPSQARKKKTHRAEATLAKNPAQLKNKKLEMEFSVDPLFKKTCADFDEGGAQGLLLNHLSLGLGGQHALRVIFDAGDAMGVNDDEEAIEEPEDDVDLGYLRSSFLPDLSVLEDKTISHSLAKFSFSKDAFSPDETFLNDQTRDVDHDDDDDQDFGGAPDDFGAGGMDVDGAPPGEEDFFAGDQGIQDDYGMGGGDDYGGDNQSHGSGEGGEGEPGRAARPGGFVPFDPRRAPNERDLVMAMTDADGEGALDYFDQNFLKNWAGPEHWKLRKVVRRPDAEAKAKQAKAPKEKKEAFRIDFTSPVDSEKDLKAIQKELFAPVTRGAGINLPGTGPTAKKGKKKSVGKDKEKKDEHLLPDDMHFSSRQLVTLFLKPKFSLKMRGQRVKFNADGDEVDEGFWAQAAAEQAAGRTEAEDADETANGGAIPFNTQFFHDDYDDGPGFDDAFDALAGGSAGPVDEGEQDLLAATQGQTRRVKPEFVKYAKRAKRVDVRKLKENIWKGLDIVLPKGKKADDSMDEDVEQESVPTDPSEARTFSSVIAGLDRVYPEDKMEEISTSFCFICLLHLANEQGLKLESAAGLVADAAQPQMVEDGGRVEKIVGNIWDLKVYRDPDASPAC